MDDVRRSLESVPPDRLVMGAAGMSVVLPVGAFAWGALQGPWRGGSVVAALAAVVIVAAGLYAFRFGAPGRSG
jgi:hypothetical protein